MDFGMSMEVEPAKGAESNERLSNTPPAPVSPALDSDTITVSPDWLDSGLTWQGIMSLGGTSNQIPPSPAPMPIMDLNISDLMWADMCV